MEGKSAMSVEIHAVMKKKKKSEHNVPIHKQMKEWHKVLNQTSVNVVKKPTSFESNVNNFPHSSLTY